MTWETTRPPYLTLGYEWLLAEVSFPDWRLTRSCVFFISIEGPLSETNDLLALSMISFMKQGWLSSRCLDRRGFCRCDLIRNGSFNLLLGTAGSSELGVTLLTDHISDYYAKSLNLFTACCQLSLILLLCLLEFFFHLTIFVNPVLHVLFLILKLLLRDLHLRFKAFDSGHGLALLSF